MIRALALKELREIAGLAALGLVATLIVVADLSGLKPFSVWMPIPRAGLPFEPRVVLPPFACVGVVFTIVLGLRQSAWEAGRGTFLFLLHLPVPRRTIFLTKIATGLGAYVLCTVLPMALYAGWAASPGHYPGPFEWSMTGLAWRFCFVMPLLYLGAFLSGLRPARWHGTRLLPLVACGLFVIFLLVMPWWVRLGLPLTIAFYGLLVVCICYVAQVRDYS